MVIRAKILDSNGEWRDIDIEGELWPNDDEYKEGRGTSGKQAEQLDFFHDLD